MNHHHERSIISVALHKLRSLFFKGLFALLPITITILLLHSTFGLIKRWLQPILMLLPTRWQEVPQIEIVAVGLFIVLVGAFLRSFIISQLAHIAESVMTGVPFIKPLYSSVKQLVHAFTVAENGFKSVVLVEFPRKGSYSVAFLTAQVPRTLSPVPEQIFVSIFIPTTPNPTAGFYMMVPESDIIATSLTRQEAMALIMSGGIILPERVR